MHYSLKVILVATVLFAAGGIRADDCKDGPVDQVVEVGKRKPDGDGIEFCHTAWKVGQVITGIEVWANKDHIAGIQLTYSDGTKPPRQGVNQADSEDRHASINWAKGDKITKMNLGINKDKKGLGHIFVQVGNNQLEVKSKGVKGDGGSVDLASGLLLGVSGEYGSWVHAWEPLFMGTAASDATITDVKFDDSLDDMNAKQDGISSVTLSEVYIKNTNPKNMTHAEQAWIFAGSADKSITSSLSTTKQNTFNVGESIEIGGKVGLPFVAEGSVKSTTSVGYQYQSATTDMAGKEEKTTLSWSQGSSPTTDRIEPGHAKHCKASVFMGNYGGGYTSTAKITVAGKEYEFAQRGKFNSVSYTDTVTDCSDLLLEDIPSGANTTEAGNMASGKRAVAFLA